MMQCQANLLICLSHKNLHSTSFDMFAINILSASPWDSLSKLQTGFFQTTQGQSPACIKDPFLTESTQNTEVN